MFITLDFKKKVKENVTTGSIHRRWKNYLYNIQATYESAILIRELGNSVMKQGAYK